jgi:hypothetical protein
MPGERRGGRLAGRSPGGEQRRQPPPGGGSLGAERPEIGGPAAMAEPGAPGALPPRRGGRAAAVAAMQPAAAIGHRRLAAGAAGPGARAAAGDRGEVAGGVAVAQPAGAVRGSRPGAAPGGRRAAQVGDTPVRAGTAATIASRPTASGPTALIFGNAPGEANHLLDHPVLAAQLVQCHHADAIALHHARHHRGQPRRLRPDPLLRRRLEPVDQAVEPRRQPHDDPVADRELVTEQRSQRRPDRGRLGRRGGELARPGGQRELQRVLRGFARVASLPSLRSLCHGTPPCDLSPGTDHTRKGAITQ